MVEVFKSDVDDPKYAEILIDMIHRVLVDYEANFDLDDCDHILRVEQIFRSNAPVDCTEIVVVLRCS